MGYNGQYPEEGVYYLGTEYSRDVLMDKYFETNHPDVLYLDYYDRATDDRSVIETALRTDSGFAKMFMDAFNRWVIERF